MSHLICSAMFLGPVTPSQEGITYRVIVRMMKMVLMMLMKMMTMMIMMMMMLMMMMIMMQL